MSRARPSGKGKVLSRALCASFTATLIGTHHAKSSLGPNLNIMKIIKRSLFAMAMGSLLVTQTG